MSAKAHTLPVAVSSRSRSWYLSLVFVVILAATAVALILRPTSSTSGSPGKAPVTTQQSGGSGSSTVGAGSLQYKPLP
jgi:hypothetical protein